MKKNIFIPILILILLLAGAFLIYINSPVYKSQQSGVEFRKPLSSTEIARAKGGRAAIMATIASLRPNAEIMYDDNSSYESLCSGGTLNISNEYLARSMSDLIRFQNANSSEDVGVICLSSKEKYVIFVEFNESLVVDGIDSYCVDSEGKSGNNESYTLDKENISCSSVF